MKRQTIESPVDAETVAGPRSPTPATAIRIAASIASLSLAGCASAPTPPDFSAEAPATWKETADATADPVLPSDWWTIFDDESLNALEAQSVAANQDLLVAVARVDEARALARVSHADRSPQITADTSFSRNHASENRAGLPAMSPAYFNEYYTGNTLSYEIDLWGRVRHSNEAAQADASATMADLHAVLLTLTADVAGRYHQLRALDDEIAVIRQTISLRRETVHLQETRYQSGLIDETDVMRARTELANVEAELHATARTRAQVEHALAVLCGQPPATFTVQPASGAMFPPAIPVGLPSSLLQRRPDIAAAESRLHATATRVAVAQTASLPGISLTGAAGFASSDLSTLLKSGSMTGSIGPSITMPILDGGANRANLAAAEARYEQAVAQYRATALVAFREVEDALSDLHALALQTEAVERALVSARDTAALANERYEKGISSYLDVVDAQRVALNAERQHVGLRGEQNAATIQLAKALGGGWTGS